jgi:hypothetical protein
MVKRLTNNFLILFFLIFLSSCKQETITPVDLGYSYFPTDTGHWVIYDIDSTYYNDFTGSAENYHYKIKELIASSYLDNENRLTQRIERYKCTDSVNWHLIKVWASNRTSSTAEKVEENVRFVKLVFPIVDEKTWNGNADNTLGEQDYEYKNVFKPYTMNGVTFDSTITVIQENDTNNFVYSKYIVEVYAKNIGMIFKQLDTIQKHMYPYGYPHGVKCIYKIISFGNKFH